MDKKCTEYEALFIFRTEEELMNHLQNCQDCANEHKQMMKVTQLLQEVKPYYKKKQRNFVKLKAACALFLILTCGTALSLINLNTDISDTLKYGNALSAEDLGLPVDSYGLIYFE